MRRVSPLTFSVWQRATTLGVWLLLPVILVGGAAVLGAFIRVRWWEVALTGLFSGGLALGYLAWGLSNDWHGLVRRPRTPWQVSFEGARITLRTGRFETVIPVERVRAAWVVAEGSWETMKGVEDECLVLRVRGALQVSVPGSSVGYDTVRSALAERMDVGLRDLGGD